jgi:hypothetical protein
MNTSTTMPTESQIEQVTEPVTISKISSAQSKFKCQSLMLSGPRKGQDCGKPASRQVGDKYYCGGPNSADSHFYKAFTKAGNTLTITPKATKTKITNSLPPVLNKILEESYLDFEKYRDDLYVNRVSGIVITESRVFKGMMNDDVLGKASVTDKKIIEALGVTIDDDALIDYSELDDAYEDEGEKSDDDGNIDNIDDESSSSVDE